ncbi:hypothetical protein C0J52_15022 [Blattella germanica]|nr:hypothetical protein C0J52_15022 [Blattella germanica]
MNTNVAADDLAKFLDGLILQIDNGARKDFTVVGFNLGAQVVGLAAKRMKQGPLPRIIALDPSKPLFEFKDDSKRLASKDAEFLLTIHTAGGFIAFSKPIGHVDFYPNGGIAPQPPCSEEGSEKDVVLAVLRIAVQPDGVPSYTVRLLVSF